MQSPRHQFELDQQKKKSFIFWSLTLCPALISSPRAGLTPVCEHEEAEQAGEAAYPHFQVRIEYGPGAFTDGFLSISSRQKRRHIGWAGKVVGRSCF